MNALRARDLSVRSPGPVDPSPLAGSWINTETRRRWLTSIEIRVDGDRVRIHPRGRFDWGEREAEMVCAASIDSAEAGGCVARFPPEAELHATLNQGLLVVVAFQHTMVAREFFRRAGDAP